jgi:transposase-like protein
MAEKTKEIRHSYRCTKCHSTYTDLRTPILYSRCPHTISRDPNPKYCGATLIKTK